MLPQKPEGWLDKFSHKKDVVWLRKWLMMVPWVKVPHVCSSNQTPTSRPLCVFTFCTVLLFKPSNTDGGFFTPVFPRRDQTSNPDELGMRASCTELVRTGHILGLNPRVILTHQTALTSCWTVTQNGDWRSTFYSHDHIFQFQRQDRDYSKRNPRNPPASHFRVSRAMDSFHKRLKI